MKKLIAMIVMVAVSCGAFAQQEPVKKDSLKMKKTEVKKTKTTTKTKKDSTNHK